MAYEYEKDIPEFLKGIETEHPLELSKEIKEVREVYRKAKAFDEIYKFLSNSPIEPFFKEYLERIANELEDNNND
ncbi:hypothetical protein ACWEXP_04075 [Staphylococcus pseudoxylosus]